MDMALAALLAARTATAPAPVSCSNWAHAGECEKNPSFMWADCAASCRDLGLREPWGEIDDKARAGPLPNAQVLELRLANASLAPMRVALRADLSPKTAASIVAAVSASRGMSRDLATFYRNEAVPTSPPGQCGEILCGPYSLVQGRLQALVGTPSEATPTVRRGFAARIQQGADFFIALADHEEWGHAFTVWGEMIDEAGMATLETIARMPYHEQAGAGGTIMRLLDTELPVTGTVRSAGVEVLREHEEEVEL